MATYEKTYDFLNMFLIPCNPLRDRSSCGPRLGPGEELKSFYGQAAKLFDNQPTGKLRRHG